MKNIKNNFCNKKLKIGYFLFIVCCFNELRITASSRPKAIQQKSKGTSSAKKPTKPLAAPKATSTLTTAVNALGAVQSAKRTSTENTNKKKELLKNFEENSQFTKKSILQSTDMSYTLNKITLIGNSQIPDENNFEKKTAAEKEMLNVIKILRTFNPQLTQIAPELLLDALKDFISKDQTVQSYSKNSNKNESNLANISTNSIIMHVTNFIKNKISPKENKEIKANLSHLYIVLQNLFKESPEMKADEQNILRTFETALFDAIQASITNFINSLFNNISYITIESLKRYITSVELFIRKLHIQDAGEENNTFMYQCAVPFELFENLDNPAINNLTENEKLNYYNSIFYLLIMHFLLFQEKSTKLLKHFLMPLIQLNSVFMTDFGQFFNVDEKKNMASYDLAIDSEIINIIYFDTIINNSIMLKEVTESMRLHLGKNIFSRLLHHPVTNNDNASQNKRFTINNENRIIDIYELSAYLYLGLKENEQSNIILFQEDGLTINNETKLGQFVPKNISSLLCAFLTKYDLGEILTKSNLITIDDGSNNAKNALLNLLCNIGKNSNNDNLLNIIKTKISNNSREIKSITHLINRWYYILKNLSTFTSSINPEDLTIFFSAPTTFSNKTILNANAQQYAHIAPFNIIANSMRILLSSIICVQMLGEDSFVDQLSENGIKNSTAIINNNATVSYMLELQKNIYTANISKFGSKKSSSNFINFIYGNVLNEIAKQSFKEGRDIITEISKTINTKYNNSSSTENQNQNQDTIKKFFAKNTNLLPNGANYQKLMYTAGSLLQLFNITQNPSAGQHIRYYIKPVRSIGGNLYSLAEKVYGEYIPLV